MRRPPSDKVTGTVRAIALSVSAAAASGACLLFLQVAMADGLIWLDQLRAILILIATFWLAWGAMLAILGLVSPTRKRPALTAPITSRTVVIVPVYHEDPITTFTRIAAMDAEVRGLGLTDNIQFAILSDSSDPRIIRREAFWFLRLLEETAGEGRIFYRRRAANRGRKAGNVGDFIRASGAAWDHALILDADSLMTGATMAEMIRRIDADPALGLLQSPPTVIRARSRFGRAMQFAAAMHGHAFGRGLAILQGRSGPFWGHNAIVRIRAFAESCGLPELSGPPPFGGHVLSHDYVEAALLARAGWTVRLDTDLDGSFEEGPENIVLYARRDRRWCQGNLQHARILPAPGLKPWSRFVFLQGILSYVAPVLWVIFLMASIFAPAFAAPFDYFQQSNWPFPTLPTDQAGKAIALALGVFGLLVLPKLAVATDAALRGRARRGFGGTVRALASTLAELVLSSLTAPVFLMFQARALLQVLSGRDGGWPAQSRGDGQLTPAEAWEASFWIVLAGLLVVALTLFVAPDLLLWLLPVTLPMIAAPLIISWTSRPARTALFTTPSDTAPALVIQRHDAIVARWQGLPPAPDGPQRAERVTHA
jgi:membrane glycosyltransferase